MKSGVPILSRTFEVAVIDCANLRGHHIDFLSSHPSPCKCADDHLAIRCESDAEVLGTKGLTNEDSWGTAPARSRL